MNNQSMILLAIGAFVALIVTVAAVDQYFLNEHPPTEVEGLIWRIENAFNRIQDLEATLQVTNESRPAEIVRMKVRYVKGPPPVLSMRYVPPQESNGATFVSAVGDETFTVDNDQLFHYIPSEDIVVSKRWPGIPLVAIGLGIFDVSQLRSDWLAGKTEIRILQDISGFTGLSSAPAIHVTDSFSRTSDSDFFTTSGLPPAQQSSLCFSFCPEFQEGGPLLSLGVAESLDAGTRNPIPGTYILEVRDPKSKDLLRMIWVDRETYIIQKVVTFQDGERDATLLIQLMTIDQGLTEAEVIPPPQADVENIRG
jgi:outer membrane lipoprotein-sorting protein